MTALAVGDDLPLVRPILGRWFKKLREEQGKTLEAVAAPTRLSLRLLGEFESGTAMLNDAELRAYMGAAGFGLNVRLAAVHLVGAERESRRHREGSLVDYFPGWEDRQAGVEAAAEEITISLGANPVPALLRPPFSTSESGKQALRAGGPSTRSDLLQLLHGRVELLAKLSVFIDAPLLESFASTDPAQAEHLLQLADAGAQVLVVPVEAPPGKTQVLRYRLVGGSVIYAFGQADLCMYLPYQLHVAQDIFFTVVRSAALDPAASRDAIIRALRGAT